MYRDEKRLAFIITWMVIGLFIINASNMLKAYLGNVSELFSNINKIVILILIIAAIRIIFQRMRLFLLIFIIGLTIVILLNILFSGNSSTYLYSTLNTFFVTVFPIIVIVGCCSDFSILIRQLTRASIVIICISVFVLILAIPHGYSYSMGFANSLIIPIIIMFYTYFNNKSKWSLLLSIMGIVVIIAIGSRGALLSIGIYFLISVLLNKDSKNYKIKLILTVLVCACCIIYFEQILLGISKIFDSFGINSRTLYLLLNDRNNMSGREMIYSNILNEIINNPFKIRGIAGEYAITGDTYAHNIFLELLSQFGIIFGGITIAVILYFIIKDIFFIKKSVVKDIIIIFLAASIPLLFVSGSLWINVYFWMWIILNIGYKYFICISNTLGDKSEK